MPNRFAYIGNPPPGGVPVLCVQFAKSSPGSAWQLATSAFQIMSASLAAKYPLLSAPRLSVLTAAEGSVGDVWRKEMWNQPGDGYLYGSYIGASNVYRRVAGGGWVSCLTVPTGYTISNAYYHETAQPVGCANGYWWFAVKQTSSGTIFPMFVPFDMSSATVVTTALAGGQLHGIGWVGGSVNRWLCFQHNGVYYNATAVPSATMSWTATPSIIGTGWGQTSHVMTVNGYCIWSNPGAAGDLKHSADGATQVTWSGGYRDAGTWWDWTNKCFRSCDWSASTTLARTPDLSAFNGTAPTWTVDATGLSANVTGNTYGGRGLACDDGSQWWVGPPGCAYMSPAGAWMVVEDGVGFGTAASDHIMDHPTCFDGSIILRASTNKTALQKIPLTRDRLYIPAINVPDATGALAGDLGQPYMKVR